MQETDFAPADGFSPIDPPVFLGLDPTLLVALILIGLALAAGMYLLGRWRADRSGEGPDDAPAEIHAAILRASRDAMAADSNDLRGRVQALRELIDRLLGPLLLVGGEMSAALAPMDAAIKGKTQEDHGHGHPHGGHGHAADDGHGASGSHGGGTDHPAPARTTGGGAAAASAIAVIGLPLHIAPAHAESAPHHPPAGDPPTRSMSHDEQTSALALSARRFNDYWAKSDRRIRELRAARAALSRRPPAGSRSAGDRVWDRRS